jgi:spoIIIJ-associated protein
MIKIEASTLAEAYEKAALQLSCSITQLRYEVIQHPSKGLFGLFKKSAIIVAECKLDLGDIKKSDEPSKKAAAAEQTIETVVKQEVSENSTAHKNESKQKEKHQLNKNITQQDDAVLGSFFDQKERDQQQRLPNNNLELAEKIEAQLKELFSHSRFAIDRIEVDVVENAALVFIDGDDAALLIGKEGYRYNALSYMLFNWLHSKYNLFLKLEIAQFLTTQQEMIRNYIKPVIEQVHLNGRAKTRPLDGILAQIALEQLREEFPHKYVAMKTGRDERKFIVINDFNTPSNV